MFERSNIPYVWIDDIAVNVFKFSAGVQRNGLDCKMLHSVFRTTLRTANMALIWGHGEKSIECAQIYYCIKFMLLECVFATNCIHSLDRLLENGTSD